jgi:hypothetical protein
MVMRTITTHKAHEKDWQPVLTAMGNHTIAGAEQDYEICYAVAYGLDALVPIHFVSPEFPGVTNEVLLAIVKDRLEGFQSGKFPCQENEDALSGVNQALKSLHERTVARIDRGGGAKG